MSCWGEKYAQAEIISDCPIKSMKGTKNDEEKCHLKDLNFHSVKY